MIIECNLCGCDIEVSDPDPSEPPLSIIFAECPKGSIDIRMTLYACTPCLREVEEARNAAGVEP